MQYDTLTFELKDGAARITMNRPDVMNALNAQMRAELTDAVTRGGREAAVVLLTGAGRAFCTGQDLGDASSLAKLDLERVLRDEYGPLIRAIHEASVPVIAAVNGPAAGAGANLALAADLVIASESAYFLQAFSRIGLMPDAGGTWFLPQAVGRARAMGAALFAEKISAREAQDWGLIWEAVSDDAFAETVERRVAQIATGPGRAFAAIKTALRATPQATLEAQLALEARLQGQCGQTRDFREGVMAFLEKRPASFEGR